VSPRLLPVDHLGGGRMDWYAQPQTSKFHAFLNTQAHRMHTSPGHKSSVARGYLPIRPIDMIQPNGFLIVLLFC
jgi:hypothetical protein